MAMTFWRGRAMICIFLAACLFGCAAPVRKAVEQPPPLPEGIMNARWGGSIADVKKAVALDRNRWFQDSTDKPPHALYASGQYFDAPAIFSYFFTPKSKQLYRVDVTFDDLRMYDKGKDRLIQSFKKPSFSQPGADFWSWTDQSLIILQKDSTHTQISYSSGPFLMINHREGQELGR